MNKQIELLKRIEKEKNIKILFAVESGSRAWKLSSKDSDFDIRFVFFRKPEEYISINSKPEVITQSFDKNLNPKSPPGCEFDIQGFDIIKFVKMLWSSNPTTIEWLISDIVYLGKQPEKFVEFAKENFKSISLFFHYKSMCKQNYLKYLKSGDLVTYKKYLYSMRGLVNAKYVQQFNKIPPINFNETLDLVDFNLEVKNKLKEIIKDKREGKERDIIQNIVKIDNYIEEFLKENDSPEDKKTLRTTNELDELLKNIIFGDKNE